VPTRGTTQFAAAEMTCKTCRNTYVAAKKRHYKCVESLKDKWHQKTLCGAIASGDRRVYDKIKDMDAGRTSSWDIVNAAAKEGWRDVVADHHRGLYTRAEAETLMMNSMGGHHLDMCDFVYLNYYKEVVDINEYTYRSMLGFAIKSGSIDVVHWFEENFRWRFHYIYDHQRNIFTQAIMADDVQVLEYLWNRLDTQVHNESMRHWYLEDAISKSPNAFKFLVDKCTHEFGYTIEPGFKDWVLLRPRYAYENIVALYSNNSDWGERFKHTIEQEIHMTTRPAHKRILMRIREFARGHGLYGINLLQKIRELIGDVEVAREPVDMSALMSYIDDMDIPEWTYVRVCKLMRKLHDQSTTSNHQTELQQ
jgi:hypothetical protein